MSQSVLVKMLWQCHLQANEDEATSLGHLEPNHHLKNIICVAEYLQYFQFKFSSRIIDELRTAPMAYLSQYRWGKSHLSLFLKFYDETCMTVWYGTHHLMT
eukprot:666035_1